MKVLIFQEVKIDKNAPQNEQIKLCHLMMQIKTFLIEIYNLSKSLKMKPSMNFSLSGGRGGGSGESNIQSISPSVWITCSNKLQSLKALSYSSSTNSSVYHHLLNHAQCLSSVSLIKEQNCVDVLILINTSHFFCLLNFLFNIFVCGTPMHLVVRQMQLSN